MLLITWVSHGHSRIQKAFGKHNRSNSTPAVLDACDIIHTNPNLRREDNKRQTIKLAYCLVFQ